MSKTNSKPKNNNKSQRLTRFEVADVLEHMEKGMLTGMTKRQLFNQINIDLQEAGKPPLSDQTMYRYYRKARQSTTLFSDQSRLSMVEKRKVAIKKYTRIAAMCEKRGDMKTLLSAEKEIARLNGLDDAELGEKMVASITYNVVNYSQDDNNEE